MQKIQNNRPAAPRPQHRGIWGAGRQVPSPPRYGGYGTVTAIQQRGWEPPKAPSLAEQAAAAARQRRLSTFSEAEQKELQAVHLALRDGGDVSSLSSTALHALEASPVLLAELESAARHKSAAAAAEDLAAQQRPLTEYDCVMLTMRPSIGQGASPDNPSCLLLRACTPRSSKPVDLAAAAQATLDLNEAIFDEIGACDAPASVSKVAALKAALTRSALQRNSGVPEFTMRCKCRVGALTDSRLLRPNQKQSRIQLASGLALEVVRMPDPWEKVVVTMKGLSSAVPMAQASLIVAALLKGTPYELSAGAQCKSAVGSGRELMGITIASACTDEQDTLSRDHNLYLTVRRDSVDCLPPVTSVLMVWPSTVASAERSELTWVRFEVDAKDGHTDARRCDACGEDGHAASLCTAQSAGHRARFTCFVAVPPQQAAAGTVGSARHQRAKTTTAAAKQQQQQPAVGIGGFAVANGSARAVNKQLNQQGGRQLPAPATSSPAAASGTGAASPPQLAGTADERPAELMQAEEEAPIDPAIVVAGEQLEQKRRLEHELDQRHLALAMCLGADGTVAPAYAAKFLQLQAEHEASLAALSRAYAGAAGAVTALLVADALASPKGKGKYTQQGAILYQREVKAFKQAVALRDTELATARDHASRLKQLTIPYQSFAQKLQQCSTERQVSNDLGAQPSLVVDAAGELTPDDDQTESPPMSPVISIPAGSQDTSAATAETLQVGSGAAAAVTSAQTTASSADRPDHLRPQAAATQPVQLEQQRDALLASRMNFLDHAERSGADAEQSRLGSVLAANRARAAVQSNTAGSTASVSDTEVDKSDSGDSGTSESSESEFSDVDGSQDATVEQQSSVAHTASEASAPRRVTRAATLARSSTTSSTSN